MTQICDKNRGGFTPSPADQISVSRADFDHLKTLIGARVFYSIEMGLPLDKTDGEAIVEAHQLLQRIEAVTPKEASK